MRGELNALRVRVKKGLSGIRYQKERYPTPACTSMYQLGVAVFVVRRVACTLGGVVAVTSFAHWYISARPQSISK